MGGVRDAMGRWARVLVWVVALAAAGAAWAAYPAERRVVYADAEGAERVYLVQEPAGTPAGLFIYAHGAGGLEEQGMSPAGYQGSFKRLRTLLAQQRWVYVCPREPDFASLLPQLRARYGRLRTVLAGASAGGRRAYQELGRLPQGYVGAILLCPAVAREAGEPAGLARARMPIWIETGAEDKRITESARWLARYLEAEGREHRYVEIAGGNHDAPVKLVDWRAAFAFVTKAAGRDR